MRTITMPRVSARLMVAILVALSGAGAYAYEERGEGPHGSIVFYSVRDGHPNNQIYVMNPDGGDPDRITFDSASDVDPDISPKGREIVFTSNQSGNNDIYVQDRRGVVRNLTNNPANDEWARWSPDGKQIVFDSNRNGGVFEVYVMNVDGSNVTQLTAGPVLGRYPSWSPDGKQIVFRRAIDIYVMNADGTGTPAQLTSEVAPSFAQMPVWSPNGRHIAFMSFREGYCSVFRMHSDGSQQINLTPKTDGPTVPVSAWCSKAPSWSANGRRIYFQSLRPDTGGLNQIFSINFEGGDLRQLTDTAFNGSPRASSHGFLKGKMDWEDEDAL
jgi:Tol biopolymer transport system component